MDISDIKQMKLEARADRLGSTNQTTIIKLLQACEAFLQDEENKDRPVLFDFSGYYPIGFCSWRGSYEEFAIIHNAGHTGHSNDKMTLEVFYNRLKACLGATFTGYKGGDFVMTESTPVWVVVDESNSGSTAATGLIKGEYYFIIQTEYCEY